MSELYTIGRIAWIACKTHIAQFSALTAAYDLAFVAARLAEFDAAELLPDYQARNSVAQNLRTDLVDVNDRVLLYFKQLQRYITYAYPVAQHAAQYDAAGYGYYSEAANLNWDSSAAMLVSMTNFIAANSVDLLATSNMPPTFEAAVLGTKSAFDTIHQDFLIAENDAFVATETKVAANNLCYQNMIAMFTDARYIGLTPAELKSFTFSSLLTLVTNIAPSQLKGQITDSTTGAPVPSAIIEITNLGISAITDANGNYFFNSLPAGTYNVLAKGTGYLDYTGVVVVASSAVFPTIFNIQMSV